MAHIEGEIFIGRPVDVVFDFVADERNEPTYNPRMLQAELISDGPIGPGSQFRAVTKSMGRLIEMTIEITAYERPHRMSSATRMAAADILGTLTFKPDAGGTRMNWSWDVRPKGLSKLLGPLVARVGQRQERGIWTNLKRCLEGSG